MLLGVFVSLAILQCASCGLHNSFSTSSSSSPLPIPTFPLQFTGNLQIISHLISEESEYPPQRRDMKIYYDYVNKLARADIAPGYEAAKEYYRNYQDKVEHMVRKPPINDCHRAYLGEKMPFPDLSEAHYVGTQTLQKTLCHYFVHNDYDSRAQIFIATTGEPVKLTLSSVRTGEDGVEIVTDLLTYQYSDVTLGPPPSSVFQLPEPYAASPSSSCERQVGGFPYLHVFHYFVRF